MLDYRSTVAAAACAGAMLVACAEPDLPSDLRISGPPHVTAVTVLSDPATSIDPDLQGLDRLIETATFCRLNDEKRPSLVGLPDIRIIAVCPEDLKKPADEDGVATAVPPQWFVRVVFDMLLDPKVEDLVPDGTGTKGTFNGPNRTQPVSLKCNGADIEYDGYYSPNGNRGSWPLGPALVVVPTRPTDAPVDATCTVSVRDTVHNKRGESLSADQRDFTFKLLKMTFRFAVPDPADNQPGELLLSPKTPLEFFFTAALKKDGTLSPPGPDPDPDAVLTLTALDKTKVKITSAPSLDISVDNPDGDPDPTVCGGTGGTRVPEANIRAYRSGPGEETSALVMRLDVGGPTEQVTQVWQPSTTYRVEFLEGATVAPDQGGPAVELPLGDDYTLCFHTSAM